MPNTKQPVPRAVSVRPRARRGLVLAACLLGCGCGSFYQDQVEVPGTNQRLAVGHDSWPSAKVWVVVDGKEEAVKIVKEGK